MAIAPARYRDAVRAAAELAWARLRLGRMSAREIHALGAGSGDAALDAQGEAIVRRVAHVIPRVAARLPWRADCLVQALAARRWLAGAGIAAALELGARTGDGFAAHAWLRAGGMIVTGGDITGYAPFSPNGEIGS